MGGIELRAQGGVVAAPPSGVCRARAAHGYCTLCCRSQGCVAAARRPCPSVGSCRLVPHLGYPIWVVTTCPRPLSDELHIRSAATSLASEPGIASHGWSDHVESWGGRDRNRNGDCYFGGHGYCETKAAGRSTTQQGATAPLGDGVPTAERSSAGQQILSSELARSTDAAELRLTGLFGGTRLECGQVQRPDVSTIL